MVRGSDPGPDRRATRTVFFATVFFGSGILFVALLFIGGVMFAVAPSVSYRYLDQPAPSAAMIDLLAVARLYDHLRLREPGGGRVPVRDRDHRHQERGVPALVSILSYLLGAVLLLAVSFVDWAILVLPAWVAVVSVFILLRERSRRRSA